MSNNNDRVIYMSNFDEKVPDGPVKFLITDAEYSVIESKKKKEEYNAVKITVEVQELDNPDGESEIKDILIFEDFKPRSFFHQFVGAAIEGLRTTSFTPKMLIAKRGEAVLSHFKPENSEIAYPQMNNWVFYAPTKDVDAALEKYLEAGNEFSLDDEIGQLDNEDLDY